MYVLQGGPQLGKLVGGLFLGSYGLGIVLNGKGLRCSQYFTGAPLILIALTVRAEVSAAAHSVAHVGHLL
jgi:hypothetical protein